MIVLDGLNMLTLMYLAMNVGIYCRGYTDRGKVNVSVRSAYTISMRLEGSSRTRRDSCLMPVVSALAQQQMVRRSDTATQEARKEHESAMGNLNWTQNGKIWIGVRTSYNSTCN